MSAIGFVAGPELGASAVVVQRYVCFLCEYAVLDVRLQRDGVW